MIPTTGLAYGGITTVTSTGGDKQGVVQTRPVGPEGVLWEDVILGDGIGKLLSSRSNATGQKNLLRFIHGGTTYVVVEADRFGVFGSAAQKRGATDNATDLASVIALANALKADLQAFGFKH